MLVSFLQSVAFICVHKDAECVSDGIHRVNCITPSKIDGLEALVGGLCGRGPGTVHMSKV